MNVSGFDSFRDFAVFALAREFSGDEPAKPDPQQSNWLICSGETLTKATLLPLDFALRQLKNPSMAVVFTIAALVAASVFFYPLQTAAAVQLICPWARHIARWQIRLLGYSAIQLGILGLGIRTLGRLNDPKLMEAYRLKTVAPISIGSVKRSEIDP